MINGLYGKPALAACAQYAMRGLVYRIYHSAFYTNRSLRHARSKYRLVNQVYALPARAPKPYPSHTSRGKDRAGRAVGGKIGGKKGRSGGRGGASGVITASI